MVFVTLKKYMKYVLLVGAVFMVLSMCYYGIRGVLPGGQDSSNANEPVAKVNGQVIKQGQFLQALASEMNNYLMYYGYLRPEDEEVLRVTALDRLITDELLLQAIDEEKIKATKAEINAELDKYKAEFESEKEFKEWLKNVGITQKILENYISDVIRISKLIELKMGTVEITEDDIRDYYEGVELSQIFIEIEDENAFAIIQDVHAKLINGEDFAELALEYSDDMSAFYGGEVGFIRRSQFDNEKLEEAAFALDVGNISPIISTDEGYYIFKITSKKLANDEAYEQEKEAIREQLLDEERNKNANEWFEAYRATATIEIYDSRINAYNFYAEGKYDEAIAEYEKAITEDPDDAYLYVNLATVYSRKEDNESAILNYEKAIDLASSDANLRWTLGNAYLKVGRQDEAIAELRKASELAYENTYDNLLLHFYLQMTFYQLGLAEDADAEAVKVQEIQMALYGQDEDEAGAETENSEDVNGDVGTNTTENGE